jgi:hypothetical protein
MRAALRLILSLTLLLLLSWGFALTNRAYAVPCSFNFNGDTTVSSACALTTDAIEGTDGCAVDEAATANTATLTVSGAVLTVTAGTVGTTTLTTGNIIVTGANAGITIDDPAAQVLVGNGTWVADGDADGYALNTTYYSATAAGRRRVCLMRAAPGTTIDCNDASYSDTNSCWSYAYGQAWYYAYSQAWYYAYSQSWYYGYSQSYYYGQGTYYGYGQSAYCFLAGTKVLMADGSYKNIEDVMPGDRVISYDVASGALSPEVVVERLVHPNSEGGYLLINGKLKSTGNHLFFRADDRAWIRADSLRIGDTLIDEKGNTANVNSIEAFEGTNTTYNLHLTGPNNNYFVEGFLVHNAKV